MGLEEMIEVEGVVTKNCHGKYTVKIDDSDQTIECTMSGKIRTNKIFIIEGDRVKVRISPYDVTKGIIFYRYR